MRFYGLFQLSPVLQANIYCLVSLALDSTPNTAYSVGLLAQPLTFYNQDNESRILGCFSLPFFAMHNSHYGILQTPDT